jgi:hypothetical protein
MRPDNAVKMMQHDSFEALIRPMHQLRVNPNRLLNKIRNKQTRGNSLPVYRGPFIKGTSLALARRILSYLKYDTQVFLKRERAKCKRKVVERIWRTLSTPHLANISGL